MLWIYTDIISDEISDEILKQAEINPISKKDSKLGHSVNKTIRDSYEIHCNSNFLNSLPKEACKRFSDSPKKLALNQVSGFTGNGTPKESDILSIINKYIPPVFNNKKLIGIDKNTFYLLSYKPGQFFKPHKDGCSQDSFGNKSLITALLYLSNPIGGDIRFYNEHEKGIVFTSDTNFIDIKCNKNTLILMWHDIKHESLPVLKGVKYVLRFNILYEK